MAQPESLDEVFEMMEKGFKPDAAAGLDLVFQYRISGDAGGDWNITVKDQTCKIVKGLADSPTTTIKISDEDFILMLTKELEPMTAFTSGKLKIEGDMMKAQVMGTLFEEPKE